MIQNKNDVVILKKYHEVDSFTRDSNINLDAITDEQSMGQHKFSINPDLRPWAMNIEKAQEMIMNIKIERPKGERMYNSNQIPSQQRSIQQDLPNLPNFEDTYKGLPPLDSTKHRRSVASIEQFVGETSNKYNRPSSTVGPSIDSGPRLFQKENSTHRKNETPVFET